VLEQRALPSTITVVNDHDAGRGSLRSALERAHDGDRIDFDPRLAGHTIRLTSGPLQVATRVTVEGLGADRLTVSGNHVSRDFEVAAGVTAALSGLALTDGMAADKGGAILNGGALTLRACVLSNNTVSSNISTFGGAVENQGDLTVLDSTFSGNAAASSSSSFGGALDNEGTLTVSGSTFSGNTAYAGGGIVSGILHAATLTVRDSSFLDNSARSANGYGLGGALYLLAGEAAVADSTLSGNSASDGGAVANLATLTVRGSTLSDNSADSPGFFGGGGGAISNSGTLTVADSVLSDNSAAARGEGGGAIANDFQGTLTLWGSVLSGNSTNGDGGAVLNSGTWAAIGRCTFSDNSSTASDGGAVCNESVLTVADSTFSGNSALLDGGAISSGSAFGGVPALRLTVVDSVFSDDTAARNGGGAIANLLGSLSVTGSSFSGCSAYGGGAVWNFIDNTASAAVSDSTFTDNHATAGGAVYNGLIAGFITGELGAIQVSASTFVDNSALNNGGAIHDDAGLVVRTSTFSGNSAANGGAISTSGPASVGLLDQITNSTLFGNRADHSGGAIFHASAAPLLVESCTIDGNVAGSAGGGGIRAQAGAGDLTVHNSIVAANEAATGGQDVNGAILSQGHNLIGTTDGSSGWVDTDLTGTQADPLDPRLGPLADNGGPTLTQVLLADSPALGAGDPALLGTYDQRGVLRQGPVDIGAYQTE
jgi:predicted outer membrane repeat protein